MATRPVVFPVSFLQLAGVFLIYIGVTILYVPLMPTLARVMPTAWLNLSYLFVIFLFFLIYLRLLNRAVSFALFWDCESPSMLVFGRAVGMGIMTWFVSYPYVLVVNGVIKHFMHSEGGDQTAVQFLRSTKDKPLLLTVTLFVVILVVPFIEETLFRGFLQTWLRRYMNRFWGILCSSLLFAAVHFAPGQNNVEIVLSLLVLAGFLGYIYEKERLLWAPLALHATFNAVSSAIVLLSH